MKDYIKRRQCNFEACYKDQCFGNFPKPTYTPVPCDLDYSLPGMIVFENVSSYYYS